MPRLAPDPLPVSLRSAALAPSSIASSHSVVGSLLRLPPQVTYTNHQFRVKAEEDQSSSREAAPLSLLQPPRSLALSQLSQASSHLSQASSPQSSLQPSVIVPNVSLDLRKRAGEHISRSPIKKRPYYPSSGPEPPSPGSSSSSPAVKQEWGEGRRERQWSVEGEGPGLPQGGARRASGQDGHAHGNGTGPRRVAEDRRQVAEPPDSSSSSGSGRHEDTTAVVSPMVKSRDRNPGNSLAASRSEDEARPTLASMTSRISKAFDSSFVLLQSKLEEMRSKLQDFRQHPPPVGDRIGRIIARQLRGEEDERTTGEICWQGFQMRLNRTIQDVVSFSKKIPGFTALDQDDQISLIKGGCFEVACVVCAPFVDAETNTIFLLGNGALVTREEMKHGFPLGEHFVELFFNLCNRFNAFKLSDAEKALFSALVLISPDRQGVRNREKVGKLQEMLIQAVQAAIATYHAAEHQNLFPRLLMSISSLRELGVEHRRMLESLKGQMSFPHDLYAETFDLVS